MECVGARTLLVKEESDEEVSEPQWLADIPSRRCAAVLHVEEVWDPYEYEVCGKRERSCKDEKP